MLLIAAAVLTGTTRASAAPSALVPPLRPAPAPSEVPAELGGSPCLPLLGCDPLGGLGKEAASAMANAVLDAFASFVADGVRAVLDQVATAIADTTEVKLDRQWFQDHFNVMRSLALLVLLPLMLVGIISAIIHRDVGQLLRAGGVYVPVAVIGGAVSIVLTAKALQLSDWATNFVTGDLGGSVNRAFAVLAEAVRSLSASGSPDVGTFLAVVVLLVLMAGAVLIWIELLLRTSAIYVVVLFLPLAMSGLVWRGTVAWTRRMVEALVALILSKFVIVVVLDLAAGMITAGDGIGTVMQGATLFLLAACAPFALLRLVPIVEAGVIGHLERMERRPVAAATRATTAVARQVVFGAEAAAAGKSVQGNGGDPSADLNGSREPGGQLNNVHLPDGWDTSGPAAGSPTGSAGVSAGSAAGSFTSSPGSPGSAATLGNNAALVSAVPAPSPEASTPVNP